MDRWLRSRLSTDWCGRADFRRCCLRHCCSHFLNEVSGEDRDARLKTSGAPNARLREDLLMTSKTENEPTKLGWQSRAHSLTAPATRRAASCATPACFIQCVSKVKTKPKYILLLFLRRVLFSSASLLSLFNQKRENILKHRF